MNGSCEEVTRSFLTNSILGNSFMEVAKKNMGPSMKADGKFADYVRSLDYDEIGPEVYAGEIRESLLSDISAVCRRAFRKKDVIVYVGVDTCDEDYEEGIVFTTEGIYSWCNNGSSVTQIKYTDITKVDYDETDVLIEHDNTTTRISLGEYAEDEKYPRHMYSFIMDILDYEEAGTVEVE